MSNLIKSVYFNFDTKATRSIDSDERIEEFIPDIFEEKKEEPSFEQLNVAALSGTDRTDQMFDNGIPVISMEDVVSQEREKLQSELQEEQESILAKAKEEAEEIVRQAQENADAIRQQAQEDGYQTGLEQGRMEAQEEQQKQSEAFTQEMDQKRAELEEQEKKLEPAFAELVVSLVRKITGISCENKKDIILYLIGNSLRNIEKTSHITIRVSKEDISRVAAKKSTLKAIAKDSAELEVVEDSSLEAMQCIIETDHSMIDCSLDAQLQNLEDHVKLLLY